MHRGGGAHFGGGGFSHGHSGPPHGGYGYPYGGYGRGIGLGAAALLPLSLAFRPYMGYPNYYGYPYYSYPHYAPTGYYSAPQQVANVEQPQLKTLDMPLCLPKCKSGLILDSDKVRIWFRDRITGRDFDMADVSKSHISVECPRSSDLCICVLTMDEDVDIQVMMQGSIVGKYRAYRAKVLEITHGFRKRLWTFRGRRETTRVGFAVFRRSLDRNVEKAEYHSGIPIDDMSDLNPDTSMVVYGEKAPEEEMNPAVPFHYDESRMLFGVADLRISTRM